MQPLRRMLWPQLARRLFGKPLTDHAVGLALNKLDALMAAHGGLRTFHRPANLEDLFLKLTGRQIREDG